MIKIFLLNTGRAIWEKFIISVDISECKMLFTTIHLFFPCMCIGAIKNLSSRQNRK